MIVDMAKRFPRQAHIFTKRNSHTHAIIGPEAYVLDITLSMSRERSCFLILERAGFDLTLGFQTNKRSPRTFKCTV